MSFPAWTDAVAATTSPVTRARALAAALPGAGYVEATFDVPFDVAWPLLADLERSVPAADPLVRRVRIDARTAVPGEDAEELEMTSWSPLGLPMRLTARMEPGWCVMQSTRRLYTIVMAAVPEPGDPSRTRWCQAEAVPRRWARPLAVVHRRSVRADIAGFRRYLDDHA